MLNIKQLEYFMVAAECKNITEAADLLHMAQPPLSRAIKALEEDLGVTLFFRSNKGIQLTDAGRLLYQEASRLFRQIEDIQTNVRESTNDLCGNIKIGACYSTLAIVTQKMNSFLKSHPACTFSMIQGNINELEAGLRDGKIDLLFLRNCVVESSDFVHITLPEDPLCLVIHKEMDTQPGNPAPTITYLRNLPLCLLDEQRFPGPNAKLFNACARRDFAPHIVCTCYDNSAGLALALNKVAATFLPRSSVSMNTYPDLNVKEVQGMDLSSCPTLIYNPHVYHTRSIQAFLSMFTADDAHCSCQNLVQTRKQFSEQRRSGKW